MLHVWESIRTQVSIFACSQALWTWLTSARDRDTLLRHDSVHQYPYENQTGVTGRLQASTESTELPPESTALIQGESRENKVDWDC